MYNFCEECKYSFATKPEGQSPPPGTVWCDHRSIQMARKRQMPCFTPLRVRKTGHCFVCTKARTTLPSGKSPQAGHVWCEEKYSVINKQRFMDCVESGLAPFGLT